MLSSCDAGVFVHAHKRVAAPVSVAIINCFAQLYGSQTKILERGTKDEMRIFEALFNGSWPKLSTHALEKCFENPHFIFCSSFQNLRLGDTIYPSQTKILEGGTKDENLSLPNEDFGRIDKR